MHKHALSLLRLLIVEFRYLFERAPAEGGPFTNNSYQYCGWAGELADAIADSYLEVEVDTSVIVSGETASSSISTLGQTSATFSASSLVSNALSMNRLTELRLNLHALHDFPAQAGLQSPSRWFRSKPKRYRTDQHRNAYVTTSSVQHGLGHEDRSKSETKIPNHVEIEPIEPRPTLEMLRAENDPFENALEVVSRGCGTRGDGAFLWVGWWEQVPWRQACRFPRLGGVPS